MTAVTRVAVDSRGIPGCARATVLSEADGDLELVATKTVRVEGARIEATARDAEVTLARGTLRARRWETS